jgi:hypothetical protein
MTIFPDYERYIIQQHPAFDQLYELKVDANGQAVQLIIHSGNVMNVVPVIWG